jgi:hypothetical protein
MKKTILVVAILFLALSACVPDFLNTGAQDAPVTEVDVAATVDTAASTQAVQTFEALATPTLEPIMEEAPATATETSAPTETATATITETPDGTPSTETITPTADSATTPTETSTPVATATSVYPSPTSPISINLPPVDEVPRHKVEVTNNTKGPVYISLHGSTEGGYHPIIEYDIPRWSKVKISVPEGYYSVIVYVGADPMTDYVGILKSGVSITIKPDELKINK